MTSIREELGIPDGVRFRWRYLWAGLGAAALAAVLLGIAGWGFGWFGKGVEVVSAGNVSEQHRAVIEDWEALQASARNACSASTKVGEGSPTFVEDPALAYAATYRRLVVDYNRRQQNNFEAGIVGPAGYPKTVPALDQGPNTDWCAVADRLEQSITR